MSRICVYPGTFDPLTNGHLDIVQRASCLFDHVIIAVAPTHRKSPCFSLADRLAMCEEVFASSEIVEVKTCDGLLVDFVESVGAKCIVRGLRAVTDFDYEFQLSGMNRQLNPSIETIFLPATAENTFVSSTMLREIIALGGDPTPFLPSVVLRYLRTLAS